MLKYTAVNINTIHQKVNRRPRLNENPLSVIEFGFLAAAGSLWVAERLWKSTRVGILLCQLNWFNKNDALKPGNPFSFP